MRGAVKWRQALEAAELLIGTVRAVGRPVVVGLEIQVFVLQVCERPAQIDDIGALADFGKISSSIAFSSTIGAPAGSSSG